jgi:hypothetical protein
MNLWECSGSGGSGGEPSLQVRLHAVPLSPPRAMRVAYSDAKVANRNGRVFGWEIAHAAVSRRPPISLDKIEARTEGYTYGAKKVWDLSRRSRTPVAPRQPLTLRFATFASVWRR